MTNAQRTRVKVCGLTRPEDVAAAVQAGVDAIGLVFYPSSKRAVSLSQASRLRNAVPPFVSVTALFVNAAVEQVQAVIDQVAPDVLQFHGDEEPEYCEGFGKRYIRAFRVGAPGLDTPTSLLDECRRYASATAWLFDSYSAGYGGSGHAFDAQLLSKVSSATDSRPVILAGGLTVATVADSIRAVRPYAVDVSSGVESAPGIKSPEKIAAFLQSVAATWE